jgi:cbb3-type cytochrome oxidase maturation protein
MKMRIDPEIITAQDTWMIVVIVVASLMFAGAAIFALAWSVKDGQFENFTRSAQSIFDPDEPIGQTTDAFPGEPEKRANLTTATPVGQA